MTTKLNSIITIISDAGFSFRGAFHPVDGDGVPDCGFPSGPGTVVLVGNIGSNMWPSFEAGRRDEPDALDSWTRRSLQGMTQQLCDPFDGVVAIHPSDGPPYYPFQRWAMRADSVYPSPIGPLIHVQYGLYHAYRGALMFRETLALPDRTDLRTPCDTCPDKPCLHTCPVDAFSEGVYDVIRCANYLTTLEGDGCLAKGCLARRACPVGKGYAYDEAQARFHMGIFRDKYAN